MVDDDCYRLSCEDAVDSKEPAGLVGRVFLQCLHIGMEMNTLHLEEFGLIEQSTIYTSAVGTFNMTELVAAGCQCWLGDKVAERTGILHLTHTYQRTSHG